MQPAGYILCNGLEYAGFNQWLLLPTRISISSTRAIYSTLAFCSQEWTSRHSINKKGDKPSEQTSLWQDNVILFIQNTYERSVPVLQRSLIHPSVAEQLVLR